MQYVRFIAAFLVYTIIDVGWNISPIAQGMYKNFYEASGHDKVLDTFGREMSTWGLCEISAVLSFLVLIAFANSYLAIEPAVRENSLLRAAKNSFVLGIAAYATYIVPIFLMIKTVPGMLVPIDILIGGLLSLVTSTVVVAVTFRLKKS